MTAVDISLWGWGACSTTLPVASAAAHGSWSERWRYKLLLPEEWAPRRRLDLSTTMPDVLSDIGTALLPPTLPDSDIPRASELDWTVRAGFPDPPDIRQCNWEIFRLGSMAFQRTYYTTRGACALYSSISFSSGFFYS